MKVGEAFPGQYLKAADLQGKRVQVVIETVEMEDIGGETKPVLHFQEIEKGLSINQTNAKNIAKITGSDNTDDWAGKKIVVYWNPDIEFGGETVGGVRVRAMKSQQPPPRPSLLRRTHAESTCDRSGWRVEDQRPAGF